MSTENRVNSTTLSTLQSVEHREICMQKTIKFYAPNWVALFNLCFCRVENFLRSCQLSRCFCNNNLLFTICFVKLIKHILDLLKNVNQCMYLMYLMFDNENPVTLVIYYYSVRNMQFRIT